ncbi:hypothetical protein LEP1GSC060_2337 [Leptospira weilii serovar Ranarum str. ICFT]|uniref:Uncharacterized protein n=1 Tax=Leptospira weilii serovar Ranarum str. ICFT TaxID=1218598 RepID=N1WQA2_9LEPT|nr:hypothetical protein LEP1GSC060_2337 [Leptospira weilii serovar Ranarum str. ICFT]
MPHQRFVLRRMETLSCTILEKDFGKTRVKITQPYKKTPNKIEFIINRLRLTIVVLNF